MKQRIGFLALALVSAFSFSTVSVAAESRPNIILFVTDDLSPDMGCYGNDAIKTPNLDALASDGVRFTNAFCTTASCSASRSVILTGLHNHKNGHYGHEHAYHHFTSFAKTKSLPVRLNAAGYRTGRIGKYHVAPESVYHFDEVLTGNSRNAVQMADRVQSFVKQDDKPFFLYFCTSDPHRGGSRPDLPLTPNAFGNKPEGYAGVDEVLYSPDDVIVPSYLPDTPVCRAELAQYYQSVSRIDQGVGRLAEVLKQAGAWDNTIVIFTSDHGIAFPGGKTTQYEPGLSIPMLVRDPRMPQRGTVNSAMISLVDMTPTILDMAGVKAPKKEFHGRSFLPILGEQDPTDWDVVYGSHTFHEIQMYYPMRTVRQRQYKLIWNIAHPLPYPFASDLWAAPTWQAQYEQGMQAMYGNRTVGRYIQRPEFELFDLKADPHETTNLADDPKYADRLAEMQAELKQFQEKTGDPWIMKWDYE
ncbi:sulfatase [Rosistilla oblonga]|uniref:sulfatase family protein n=1 Tax=Rosistilla oblonga TaxID=2527990 RepID=UPI003A96D864